MTCIYEEDMLERSAALKTRIIDTFQYTSSQLLLNEQGGNAQFSR